MEKKPEPFVGPPAPGKPAEKPAEQPAEQPAEGPPPPGRPPHWHEGDPEPAAEGEEEKHLPPKDDAD